MKTETASVYAMARKTDGAIKIGRSFAGEIYERDAKETKQVCEVV